MFYRYAGVCLLENPFCIDGIYDYEIPSELAEAIVPGAIVTVPFGTGNRMCLALVSELKETSAYKETKQIQTLCPESLFLDEEMLGLCRFLKARTLCTTGDAVRAMVPTSALSRLAELYSVNSEYQQNSDEFFSSDLFVYEYLKENGETPLSRLRERFDIRVEKSLRKLCKAGVLQRRVVFKEEKEGKTEKLWQLAVEKEKAERLANGEKTDGIKLTSAKQKSILSVLLENGDPVPNSDLQAQADAASPQLKALLEKGLISFTEKTVGRNPYQETPFRGQTEIALNEEQSKALKTLTELAASGEPKAALLYGVTGSGKTSVMATFIDRLLESGKGVILLLPEIALTPQSVAIFCSRYGSRVAVIHSALSGGERYDAYCRIRRGEADVVIGTRSAIFAPVKNLGAIIIDEEQEHTYKSDQSPRYHAKDVARYRCNYHKAVMLLASATPSVESFSKAVEGSYTMVRLNHRFGEAKLPEVQIVDMRKEEQEGNSSIISLPLATAVSEALAKGEQSILFLNRRGYNRTVTCKSCGKPLLCPNCSVALTYHTRRGSYDEGEMVCHWCGRRFSLPRTCPECGSDRLSHEGYGTQRIEEEIKLLFPTARVLRMDADTATSKLSYEHLLGKFRNHEADILLGTQMVTKGHDFPKVTVVGILLADLSLYLDDYRARERTFALLTQVIGRAGRADLPGKAIIQTANPEHEVLTLARRQDYDAFFERESLMRRLLCFPPNCDIALLTVSGVQEKELLLASQKLAKELKEVQKQYPQVELVTFGPFEAPVYRVDNRYRMRFVLKCRLNKPTLAFFATVKEKFETGCEKRIYLSVDFNPSNL